MNSKYDDKKIYKVKLNYDYFETNNLGSKVRDTLKEIEENQSFLIVYTLDKDINEFNEPLGYYLYNTRIIISPLAIKQKKEITKSLVKLIRNSRFDEDIEEQDTHLDNDDVITLDEDRREQEEDVTNSIPSINR